MTPASENIRGTSALPYHLIKGSHSLSIPDREGACDALNDKGNEKIDIEIYTFNNNGLSDEKIAEVEKELNVKINKVSLPKWFLIVFKFRLLFIRLFLKYPIHHYIKMPQNYVEEIKAKKPDLIWVYGAEWSKVVNQFKGYQRIHTLPDSEALYYYRMLGQRFVLHDWKKFWRCVFMYPKFLALERDYSTELSVHYHLVGQADADFIKNNNPGIDARFIKHPHYQVLDAQREIRFHQPRIRLLIAGQYNYYMQQEADLLVEQICNVNVNENFLREHYDFTFLGKGWEKHVESLREAGYEVKHVSFAENYQKELVKHDIQITPITIGTGTKGKVLDALANGLLVIGTSYAMENIAVQHGVSCIEYHHPDEVVQALLDIPCHIEKYEEMARQGRQQVLTQHGWKVVSDQLFNIFRK